MSSATPLLDSFRWAHRKRQINLDSLRADGVVYSEAPTSIQVALCLFVASFPFVGFMLIDLQPIGIPFGVTPNYIAGPLLVLFWLARDRKLYPGVHNPLAKFCWIYVAITFLSVLQSAEIPAGASDFTDKKPWVFSFTQSIYVCWVLAVFLVLCQVFSVFPSLRTKALRWHVFTGCFVSLWGIYQALANFLGWNYLTIFNNSPYRAELYEGTWMGLKRINSVLVEPSDLGLYLMTVIPILIVQFQGQEKIVGNGTRIFALILCVTALFLSTSFSVYLTFALFLLLFLFTEKRWKNTRIILNLAAIFLCFAAAAAMFSYFGGKYSLQEAMLDRATSPSGEADPSTLERVSTATAALQTFADHPLIGVGEANFAFYYDQYSSMPISGDTPRVDSLLPRILAEHGLLGATLFLWLVYRIFWPYGRAEKPRRSLLRSMLALAVLVCFFDLFTSFFEIEHFHVWFLAALLFALSIRGVSNSSLLAEA